MIRASCVVRHDIPCCTIYHSLIGRLTNSGLSAEAMPNNGIGGATGSPYEYDPHFVLSPLIKLIKLMRYYDVHDDYDDFDDDVSCCCDRRRFHRATERGRARPRRRRRREPMIDTTVPQEREREREREPWSPLLGAHAHARVTLDRQASLDRCFL